MSDSHDFLPKCRPFYVVLEKGHGAGEKGLALEKRGKLKLARETLVDQLKGSQQQGALVHFSFREKCEKHNFWQFSKICRFFLQK